MEKNNLYFYTFIVAFLIGITFHSFNINFLFESIFLLLMSFFVYVLYKSITKKTHTYLFLFFLLNLGFLVGFLRYQIFENFKIKPFLGLEGHHITQNLIIDGEPEIKTYHTKLILKFPKQNFKVVSWVPNYPKYQYGDVLQTDGFLLKPKNFKNELGKEFDYQNYLKKDLILYELKIKNIKIIEHNKGAFIKTYLYKIKKYFISKIQKLIPAPESFLLGGILLGEKTDMGKNMLNDFRKTGIIHIVVLSGYNLTLVADFFTKIFSIFGIGLAGTLGGIGIVLFTLMTGASATIVRAAIMALLVILAKTTNRESDTIKLLFLAAFIMLLFNPMLLIFDVSFQLSFLATLGLIILSPKIEKFLSFLIPTNILEIKSILAATLSTQIFVLPFILYLIGEISLISPITNILILIFVPLTMLLGFIMVIISPIIPMFSILIAFFVFYLLKYDLFIVSVFSKLPFATYKFNLTIIYMFIFYFFLFITIFWSKKYTKK